MKLADFEKVHHGCAAVYDVRRGNLRQTKVEEIKLDYEMMSPEEIMSAKEARDKYLDYEVADLRPIYLDHWTRAGILVSIYID